MNASAGLRVAGPFWRGISLLALLPLFAGCTFGQPPEPTPTPITFTTPNVQGEMAPTLYTVQRGAVIDAVSFPAKVSLASVEDLFFAAPGRVKAIYAEGGDTVEEGQLLAELDTRNLEFDLEAAQVALDLAKQRQAEGDVDFRFESLKRELSLQIEKQRLIKLEQDKASREASIAHQELVVEQAEAALKQFESTTTSARAGADDEAAALRNGISLPLERQRLGAYYEELKSTQAAIDLQKLAIRQADLAVQQLEGGVGPELQAEVDRATIALRKAEALLEDARIVAPFGGKVLLFDALRKGKVVQAYEPVASIVDPEAIVLEANLVPADLEYLAEGMPVQIQLAGPLPRTLKGVIQTLPQPFGTGASAVTRIVPAPGVAADSLRPGASTTIAVERGRNASALWLPPDAVQGYRGNYFVRLRDGTEVPIEVGIYGVDRVEVQSGVKEGMEVVGR